MLFRSPDGTIPDGDVVGSIRLWVKWRSGIRVVASGTEQASLPAGGARVDQVQVDEVHLDGLDGELLAWSWYTVGDYSTANNYRAKGQQALQRLHGSPQRTYRIVVATPKKPDVETARLRLQGFLQVHAEELYTQLSAARGPKQ